MAGPQICNHFSAQIRVTTNLCTSTVSASPASGSLPTPPPRSEQTEHSLLSAVEERNLPLCMHKSACREKLRYPGEGHPTGTEKDH